MAGLDPAIHQRKAFFKLMDRRVKPGDDELRYPKGITGRVNEANHGKLFPAVVNCERLVRRRAKAEAKQSMSAQADGWIASSLRSSQ
jgi:hypothetical protein